MAAARIYNELLIDDEEENEDIGYDSEAFEDSRTQRSAKRRKTSPDDADDADSDEGLTEGPKESLGKVETGIELKDHDVKELSDSGSIDASNEKEAQLKRNRLKAKRKSKTGVIYLSRVPPFMKPQAVKSLLSPFGAIGRVFLTPEDPSVHVRRVKSGGNKKRSFTDGWVEFIHKRDAKLVAETLNAQIIGGKKGGWYHDDVWNIKYLKGCKWHHLTEQIANENAERAARLRTEIAQTTKENNRFIANVEKAKMLQGIKAKQKNRIGINDEHDEEQQGKSLTMETTNRNAPRNFKQHEALKVSSRRAEKDQDSDGVQRVLSKIF